MRKDRKNDEGGDKSGAQDFQVPKNIVNIIFGDFQDPKNIVNIIFGGDGRFPSKRAQKLILREILFVEPATIRPVRYSEVPISFSRDDQWTSFSKLGIFPLILDPVMAGSQLT
jgi:hypothetical protein